MNCNVPATMNRKQNDSLDSSLASFAINAARTAQVVYGRAYFELRNDSLEKTEKIAKIRLVHSVIQQTLERSVVSAGGEIPEPDESTGPFANDPRFPLFGIEPRLVLDYLRKSDTDLLAIYSDNYQSLGLDRKQVETWSAVIDETHAKLDSIGAPKQRIRMETTDGSATRHVNAQVESVSSL